MELNRDQIIKALECCQKRKCQNCTYDVFGNPLSNCRVKKHALALIKELTQAHKMLSESYDHLEKTKDKLLSERARLTEENERLMREKTALECIVSTARNQSKADTVRKMQKEIEARCIKGGIYPAFVKSTIDQIAKEMIGEGE